MGYTKYKADKSVRFYNDRVTDEYLNGNLLVKDKYGSTSKRKLPEGATKYNVEFLQRAKDLSQKYSALISVECCLISIMKEYGAGNTGCVGNIWHIMGAQKGTVGYLHKLEDALKKYIIKHQTIYDAIKENLDSTEERLFRNMAFTDIFAKEAGLECLVEYFKENNTSFFDHALTFSSDFFFQHRREYSSKDDYHDAVNAAYVEDIRCLCRENGFDIEAAIDAVKEENDRRRKETKEKVRAVKQLKRREKKSAAGQAAFDKNAVIVFHAVENGNAKELLSKTAFEILVQHLKMYNGVCYVIEVLVGSHVEYCKKDLTHTMSLASAEYYSGIEEAEKRVEKLQKENPERVYNIHKITMPDSIYDKDTNKDSTEALIEYQNNLIKNSILSAVEYHTYLAETKLLKNDGVVWYINIIGNNNNSIRFFNNSYKGSVIRAFPYFFYSKEIAEKTASKYSATKGYNNELDGKQLCVTEYKHRGTYPVHKEILDELEKKLDKFVDRFDNQYSLRGFSSNTTKQAFADVFKSSEYIDCIVMNSLDAALLHFANTTTKGTRVEKEYIQRPVYINDKGEHVGCRDLSLENVIDEMLDKNKTVKKAYRIVRFYMEDGKLKWMWPGNTTIYATGIPDETQEVPDTEWEYREYFV